ncbi:hypothetical protein ACFQZT_04835 [Paenibacillus sp. GCM10027628]|uniref:hypothetical protein n=1 Tax=Paenibacillus sp. GCM10027628 TaxID=3273413 RepID=UPI0036386752
MRLAPVIAYLQKLINKYASDGSIDNGGITNSLLKKLEKGNLELFFNEVEAQKGKHIKEAAAEEILWNAEQLLRE